MGTFARICPHVGRVRVFCSIALRIKLFPLSSAFRLLCVKPVIVEALSIGSGGIDPFDVLAEPKSGDVVAFPSPVVLALSVGLYPLFIARIGV